MAPGTLQSVPTYSKALGSYLGPFFLSHGNVRLILRSQSLRKQCYPYVEGMRARRLFGAVVVRDLGLWACTARRAPGC